jgi:glycosyltransferase involved in cell wall biosynthesis
MPAPVEVAQPDRIRAAAADCDALIFWGMRADRLLVDVRPKLCLFLAHGETPWTRNLLEGSARVTDHVVAVSRRVRDRVCNGFRTTIIHNGVDAARLSQSRARDQVRRELGFTPSDFVVGFLGRFSPEKKAELIIEAVAQLPSNFKALLVGWGPLQEQLLEAANRHIPGRYALISAGSYLGDYYQAMDAFCLPSTWEGFSMALLEALMCGRPVIATSVGCVPEIIKDRINGVIVPGTAEAVAGAAQLLHDYPEWAAAIGREGRNYALQHGHALRMARQYEDLLETLWHDKVGMNGNGHVAVED